MTQDEHDTLLQHTQLKAALDILPPSIACIKESDLVEYYKAMEVLRLTRKLVYRNVFNSVIN